MSIFDKDIIENDEVLKLHKLLEDIENSKNLFFHEDVNGGGDPVGKLFYLELDI